MDLTLVTQPLAGSSSAAQFLTSLAADEAITHIDIVVAWAKESGFNQVSGALEGFTARGGTLRIVTGISQGGATRQGLERVANLTSDAYVFHQHTRTFHPKLYVGYAVAAGRFLVGSHNLTRGGLVANFEVGLAGVANYEILADRQLMTAMRAYVDALVADDAACKRLTPETLTRLVEDPRYLVADETASTRVREAGAEGFLSNEEWQSMFSASRIALRSAGLSRADEPTGPRRATVVREIHGSVVDPHVVRRWYKKLPASNVSRLGGNTNPQGHLTLTQGPGIKGHPRHPIRQGTYFRDVFFADAPWRPGKRPTTEVATLRVNVIARGVDLGLFSMVVEHNTSFESGQGNRSTFLHWGSELSEYLRKKVNHTDDIASLEKLSDGTFRLTLAVRETGPFL